MYRTTSVGSASININIKYIVLQISQISFFLCLYNLYNSFIISARYSNYTVDSKVIRALQIIPIKKLISMQFYEINICEVMSFRLHTVCKKHGMIKIGNQTRKKIASVISSSLMPTVYANFVDSEENT